LETDIKLNLGCGENHKDGYINVDKFGSPDVRCDLEQVPWPWEDSSVTEILLDHVLEHLGQETEVYLNIIKEIYRICKDQATVHINVPHPRHDSFLNDPTHVRIVTPDGIGLFSKKNNTMWVAGGYANTPLGIYLNVDLEIVQTKAILDPTWDQMLRDRKISKEDVALAATRYNNVISEYRMIVKVIK